jgi:integrase
MRRKRSLVIQRPGSSNFYENFSVKGHRFRGSLGTDDRATAEIIAAKTRSDALLGKITEKKPEITVTQAFGRSWLEHYQHLRSAPDIARIGLSLQTGIGKDVLLSTLRTADLATYAACRRVNLSNRSVNIEIEHLRAVVRRADSLWGVAVPDIDWQKVLLEEAGQREHVLSDNEEERFWQELRADFHPMVRFALVTGARLSNVTGLTWRQVDWDAGRIVFRVKSKKPGGEIHYLPITQTVAAILSRERGNHPVFVFTYVCARNRRCGAVAQHKGQRYPFTKNGWRKEWKAALLRAGIEDFRFHDLRHTAATRALQAYRNLKTVQRMLGHKDITTTLRYTRSDVDDVRAAMEAVEMAQSRHIAAVPKRETN